MKKINNIIRDFREDHDFSQKKVSDYLGIPRSTYGHYESGNSKIPIEILLQLCKLYNVTPNDILGFSSDFPATDISKIYKLYKFIKKENINVDKLIKFISSSQNINN